MVTARAATKGLSTTDLETIRDTLGAGRKPKVMFTEAAGQIAGQIGQVVGLTDPELSDEWVVVRFGRDELPFSPIDLMIAPKAAPNRRTNTVPAPREESPVPAPAPPLSTVDSPAAAPVSPAPAGPAGPAAKAGNGRSGAGSGAGSGAADSSASDAVAVVPGEKGGPAASDGSDGSAGPDGSAGSDGSASSAAPGEPGAAEEAKDAPKRAAKAAPAKKVAKPKAPAGLTVTLAYADGEWTVAANQGAKALAKPYLIKPAEALKMVSMLDVPGVHEAVEEIVSAARAEAEQQAERLRAELAEIEARLAELSETE
jgi:hypothetical protein